jgi:hypothetical protein
MSKRWEIGLDCLEQLQTEPSFYRAKPIIADVIISITAAIKTLICESGNW